MILDYRLSGMTYEAIGKELGVSRQRVQQIISPPEHIRNTIVQRANGKCQRCGVIVDGSGHVHHIGNISENYNDDENLELLCISCHRIAHNVYRPCPQCGRDIPQCKTNIFCSVKCRTDFCLVKIPCEVCGQFKAYRKKHIDWRQKHGMQKHFFCSRKCLGIWLGENHGFGVYPYHIRRKKWDYAMVYKAQDDTGFGCVRLSRFLNIPVGTIANILRRR